MTAERALRVVWLMSHPVQYFAPLMRALATRPELDLTVCYLSRHGATAAYDPEFERTIAWDVDLLGGYAHEFLPNLRAGRGVQGFWTLLNPGIMAFLRRRRPDVLVVHGYAHATNWLAVLAARACGIPVVLRGDSQLLRRRPLAIRAAKRIVLGWGLFPLLRGCLSVGRANAAYYRHYGVPERRLRPVGYGVDDGYFAPRLAAARAGRAAARRRFGVADDRPVVLFVGKLIAVKQPALLLRAFAAARRLRPCHLVVVGSGALAGELERLARELAVADVTFAGFAGQAELPAYYTAADVFALPSAEESWGLVVNEAMLAGLPVVVSDQVGAAADLVRSGDNGFVVRYDDEAGLAAALGALLDDPAKRQAFGARSAELIAAWSVTAAAGQAAAALLSLVGRASRRP